MNPEMTKVAFMLILCYSLTMEVSAKPHPNSNNGAGNGMKEKVDALQAKVFELEEQEAETLSFQAQLVENIHECQDNLTDFATYAQSKIDYLRRNLDIANNILEQSWYPKGKHILGRKRNAAYKTYIVYVFFTNPSQTMCHSLSADT